MDIFPAVPGTILELGKKGTNKTRAWRFDVRKWVEEYPAGQVYVLHQQYGLSGPTPVSYTEMQDDGFIDWIIGSGDVSVVGKGLCELVMVDSNGERAKTATWVTNTTATICPDGDDPPLDVDPPDPVQGWVEDVLDAATDIYTIRSDSEAWAVGKRNGVDVPSTDDTYENNSKYYSQQAGGYATDAATAKTAAETAQGKAETAQGKAEDAQTAAETAQTAAETAQGKAEDAQTAAETAQGKAEDAQTAAETAQGKAEDAQDAAEDAQTAAEVAQAAAEAAVGAYNSMTATATQLSPDATPTASIDHTGAHPVLQLGIPKGKSGVYVGSSTPTDSDVNVWIDPSGGPNVSIANGEAF